MKLKASHERHCSLAKLCFPIVIVTLNQTPAFVTARSCNRFLPLKRIYFLKAWLGDLLFDLFARGRDSDFTRESGARQIAAIASRSNG